MRGRFRIVLPALLVVIGCGGAPILQTAPPPESFRVDWSDRTSAMNAEEYPEYWLEGPLRYLLLPSERDALTSITTTEEFEVFRTWFWERRDPDLRTPENEMRQIFYDRVVQAADRAQFPYSSDRSFQRGWRSDAAKVFIVLGPPRRVEYTRAGGTLTVTGGNPMMGGRNRRAIHYMFDVDVWFYDPADFGIQTSAQEIPIYFAVTFGNRYEFFVPGAVNQQTGQPMSVIPHYVNNLLEFRNQLYVERPYLEPGTPKAPNEEVRAVQPEELAETPLEISVRAFVHPLYRVDVALTDNILFTVEDEQYVLPLVMHMGFLKTLDADDAPIYGATTRTLNLRLKKQEAEELLAGARLSLLVAVHADVVEQWKSVRYLWVGVKEKTLGRVGQAIIGFPQGADQGFRVSEPMIVRHMFADAAMPRNRSANREEGDRNEVDAAEIAGVYLSATNARVDDSSRIILGFAGYDLDDTDTGQVQYTFMFEDRNELAGGGHQIVSVGGSYAIGRIRPLFPDGDDSAQLLIVVYDRQAGKRVARTISYYQR